MAKRRMVKQPDQGWILWDDLPPEVQDRLEEEGLAPVELELELPGEEDDEDLDEDE